MQEFLSWSGWTVGIVSLGINVFQFLERRADRRLNNERFNQLVGVQRQLVQIRIYCNEQCDLGVVLKTEAQKNVARSVGHQLKGLEHTVDGMLANFGHEERPNVIIAAIRRLLARVTGQSGSGRA
jgi:hypothetical protein